MRGSGRVVCLASSRKPAREVHRRPGPGRGPWAGGWARPVSARENEDVSEEERQYGDGSDPGVPDIVDVPVLEPQPGDYWAENWLLDPGSYWEKVGTFSWRDLPEPVDPVALLWIDSKSRYRGQNDKISLKPLDSISDSSRTTHDEMTYN